MDLRTRQARLARACAREAGVKAAAAEHRHDAGDQHVLGLVDRSVARAVTRMATAASYSPRAYVIYGEGTRPTAT